MPRLESGPVFLRRLPCFGGNSALFEVDGDRIELLLG